MSSIIMNNTSGLIISTLNLMHNPMSMVFAAVIPPLSNQIRYDYCRLAANKITKRFNCQRGPVVITDILKSIGIKVKYIYDDNDIPPARLFLIRGEYLMLVKMSRTEVNINWSIAHELGHYFLNHFDETIDTMAEDILPEEKRYIIEKEAHIFATNLLMPEKWFKSISVEKLTAKKLAELKEHLGVPWNVLINRIDELGITQKRNLIKILSSLFNPNNVNKKYTL